MKDIELNQEEFNNILKLTIEDDGKMAHKLFPIVNGNFMRRS